MTTSDMFRTRTKFKFSFSFRPYIDDWADLLSACGAQVEKKGWNTVLFRYKGQAYRLRDFSGEAGDSLYLEIITDSFKWFPKRVRTAPKVVRFKKVLRITKDVTPQQMDTEELKNYLDVLYEIKTIGDVSLAP